LLDEILKVVERQFFMQQKSAPKAIKAKKEE
jgi:Ca2+ transporting ATPase